MTVERFFEDDESLPIGFDSWEQYYAAIEADELAVEDGHLDGLIAMQIDPG